MGRVSDELDAVIARMNRDCNNWEKCREFLEEKFDGRALLLFGGHEVIVTDRKLRNGFNIELSPEQEQALNSGQVPESLVGAIEQMIAVIDVHSD
jgi:hypothetical protein